MKIKILLPAIFLILFQSGKSQDVRFGITLNPGLTWVSPDNTNISGDGIRFGFDFGLIVDYIFGSEERYAFNSGAILHLSGANIRSTSTMGDTTSSIKAKANYIEIPLTIKLRSNEIGYFTFYGQLGFAPLFRVRSRADYKLKDSAGNTLESAENIKLENIPSFPNPIEKVGPVDTKLLVEAGIEYSVGSNTVLAGGLFFNTGFIDMLVDNDGERIVSRHMGLRLAVLF